jgi:EAL domain-containing protein (putative c-di-GMP-specific phosphodiesterase class I)
VAIDDCGTGYSSLSYSNSFRGHLEDRPPFVDGVAPSSQDSAIVQTIVGLADAMGVSATAERVETEHQWRDLLAAGCDRGQGYVFAKPDPAEVIARPLEDEADRLDGAA